MLRIIYQNPINEHLCYLFGQFLFPGILLHRVNCFTHAIIGSRFTLMKLVKEGRGIYYYADEFPDELQIIQANNPKVIYSYGTALYLWDMSDRTPHAISSIRFNAMLSIACAALAVRNTV